MRLAAEVTDRFGTVHVVCNNAGIGPMAPRGDLYALTHPDWHGQVERRHEAIDAAFRRAAGDRAGR